MVKTRASNGSKKVGEVSVVATKAKPKKLQMRKKRAKKVISEGETSGDDGIEYEVVERVLKRTNLTERLKKKTTTNRYLVCDICKKEIFCRNGTGNLRLHRHRHHKEGSAKVEKTFESKAIQTETLEPINQFPLNRCQLPVAPQPSSNSTKMPTLTPKPTDKIPAMISPEKTIPLPPTQNSVSSCQTFQTTPDSSQRQLAVLSSSPPNQQSVMHAINTLALPISPVPNYPIVSYPQLAYHTSPIDPNYNKHRKDIVVSGLIQQLQSHDTNHSHQDDKFFAITARFQAEMKQLNEQIQRDKKNQGTA